MTVEGHTLRSLAMYGAAARLTDNLEVEGTRCCDRSCEGRYNGPGSQAAM